MPRSLARARLRSMTVSILWSRSDGCAERFNEEGEGARKERGGSLDGSTLKARLRAAEMCDLAAFSLRSQKP
jgi:hypothetical protein